jgi:hypothetical protein
MAVSASFWQRIDGWALQTRPGNLQGQQPRRTTNSRLWNFPKGDGEGKASLTGKVTVDTASKSLALDGYDTLPVVFKAIKPQ